MRPLVPCHSVDMLRWFLGKTTVSAVFATWNGWETAFPDDLRQAAAAVSITVDFACASVKTIAAATEQTVPAGDCVVFAGGRYVGRMMEERPRTGKDWVEALLQAGVGKPAKREAEPPYEALIRVLRDALTQAAALPQFERSDPHEILGVPAGASLIGDHQVRGNFVPDIRFSVGQAHDYMEGVSLQTAAQPSGALLLRWNAPATGIGHFSTAMGFRQTGEKSGDMVMWNSSAVRLIGGVGRQRHSFRHVPKTEMRYASSLVLDSLT